MKLKNLINKKRLEEKKEALATSNNTNMTIHYDANFTQVGEAGTPEFEFTISVSSTGGKVFTRGVGDREESNKLTEGVRLDLRRALRKFDKHVQFVIDKYKLQIK